MTCGYVWDGRMSFWSCPHAPARLVGREQPKHTKHNITQDAIGVIGGPKMEDRQLPLGMHLIRRGRAQPPKN